MTRTAWFHCFAGTAGDMTLGALVHAGADVDEIGRCLDALAMDGWTLTFERTQRGGVSAAKAVVVADEHGAHHPYRDIRERLRAADLPERVRERAEAVFAALAEVEGAIHSVAPDDVEFHEVGALDAIVDVVGTCAALESLGIERVVCSAIALGTGVVEAAHGQLPNPVPAVVGLLARRGAPSVSFDEPRELATPTGVALMTALADAFGPMPAMATRASGYGAGTADVPGRPNVVQVVIGDEAPGAGPATGSQPVRLLEVNVDDVTGEVIAHTIARLLEAGAHDAWATPIVMKKGRPAHTVHALCEPSRSDTIAAVLVSETGSLGVRGTVIERWPAAREESSVVVEGYRIGVKLASGRVKVEHDDAAAAARELGLPLRDVLALAERAALERG